MFGRNPYRNYLDMTLSNRAQSLCYRLQDAQTAGDKREEKKLRKQLKFVGQEIERRRNGGTARRSW